MGRRRQPINQPRHRSILPHNSAHNLHAVALVESAGDRVLLAHTEVEIAARWLHYLRDELPEDPPARAVELLAVENLVKHDRASGHLHAADAGAFFVLLVNDDDAVLVNAMVCLDAAFECVLPNVREHIPVGLEMPIDRFEIAETRVSH